MAFSVMIVSYETLRTLTAHLANCSIGLLLCDEGHRLKNSGELIRSQDLIGAL
jgi:DNA repair and recombination RAD54-like protein